MQNKIRIDDVIRQFDDDISEIFGSTTSDKPILDEINREDQVGKMEFVNTEDGKKVMKLNNNKSNINNSRNRGTPQQLLRQSMISDSMISMRKSTSRVGNGTTKMQNNNKYEL